MPSSWCRRIETSEGADARLLGGVDLAAHEQQARLLIAGDRAA